MDEKEKELPLGESNTRDEGMPSQKQQSWGVLISIVVIMLMIIIGAFYAWGNRIAQNAPFMTATSTTTP